ncbi:unnamed protein product [Cuscuta campestris]|uniref:HpcH/HpaI aldolase/citrate lyase domain-containing protein n=2 Tax=Cuscuta sect. Cleistogrammica TaxID=1824901 RepID=A0A484LRP3_9ASTE|nr:hypothetical protein DM860_005316 [Cuscuta australis]VFQ79035.1 unnamed protein product [Cuscuta campestris]
MATLSCFSTIPSSLCAVKNSSFTSSISNKSLSIRPFTHSPPKTLSLPTLIPNHRRFSLSRSSAAGERGSLAPQTLKSRLRNGETLYGIFLLSFSPTLAEISGLAGYDFAVVDMEHGHGGISDALPCLRALAAARTPAILRIPESSDVWAKKALDLGPQGIMFPMIDSPESARKAVSYCRFPPKGIRGSAHTVVRASRYGMDESYLSNYEEELLIMCQVECESAVGKVAEIAAVEGVDCIQMGPLDLSASLGYLADPGHKKVREVLRTAEKAVLLTNPGEGNGAYLAGFAMAHDKPENMKLRGYRMVSGTVDVGLFRTAAVEDVKKFKKSLMAEDDEDEEEEIENGDDKYWRE